MLVNSDERESEMSKKELIGNRQYTQEFKLEAVRLGESVYDMCAKIDSELAMQMD